MTDLAYTSTSLDVDTALAFADDPDVQIVEFGFDRVAEHGENPELIDEGDVR